MPSTARAQPSEWIFYSAYISLLLRNIKIFPDREVAKIEEQTQETKTEISEQDLPSLRSAF